MSGQEEQESSVSEPTVFEKNPSVEDNVRNSVSVAEGSGKPVVPVPVEADDSRDPTIKTEPGTSNECAGEYTILEDNASPKTSNASESTSKKNRRKKRQKEASQPELLEGCNGVVNDGSNKTYTYQLNEVFSLLKLTSDQDVFETVEVEKEALQNAVAVSESSEKTKKKKKKEKKLNSAIENVSEDVDGTYKNKKEKRINSVPENVTDNIVARNLKKKRKDKRIHSMPENVTGYNIAEIVPQEQLHKYFYSKINRKESHGEVTDKKKKLRPKVKQSTAGAENTEGEQGQSSKSSPREKGVKNKKKKNKQNKQFEEYWPLEKLKEGLEKGELIEGVVRINPKQFKDAYISQQPGPDILIDGICDRNRALEGDVVVLQMHDPDKWKSIRGKCTPQEGKGQEDKEDKDEVETPDYGKMQKTAKVVGILSEEHSRKSVGYLKMMKEPSDTIALFCPRDSRVPRMKVYRRHSPADFWNDPEAKSKTLYVAKITKWNSVMFAIGEVMEEVGETASLEAERAALLLENDLDTTPYPSEFSEYFPQPSFIIGQEEIDKREDLRKECIFTIDPATAKDLDDAVSCKELKNGNLEIGVHISDVTFFLKEGTPLDKQVTKRATSIYLVEQVYHMLPLDLCLICSLTPGADKLAYSVIWEVTKEAKIVSQRISRSVINSCAKLAYEHAQQMIENPDKEWKPDELPPISNGFTVADLNKTVNHLQNIAVQLRKGRFKDGALRIDQTKLLIHLDPSGKPAAYFEYVNKESHRLIEEFMLLANMTTAKFIFGKFPDLAFLRCHPEPHNDLMEQLKESLEAHGIHLDTSSSGGLQASLSRYSGEDFLSKSRLMVLNAMCAKTMTRAKYFCSSMLPKEDFWHYALSVPYYTHFTSPIRRYADVMVHRLLNASLGYSPAPTWTSDSVQKIASNCNKQKYAAKLAGEQSTKLYLALYVSTHQPVVENAVVIDVKDHSFDVIVCNFGVTLRVYVNKLIETEVTFTSENKFPSLTLKWSPTERVPNITTQVIQVFTIVQVSVHCSEDSVKMEAVLIRPSSADADAS